MIDRYITNFKLKSTVEKFDIIIVGSGIAGLISAYYIPPQFKVGLFTKDKIEESNTYYAQGGIAVALAPDDSSELHFRDTILAGADFNEEKIVRIVVEEGIERVRDLIKLGVNFDKKNGLSFTQEAAHSRRRIIHAHGDATGYEVACTLIKIIKDKENIRLFDNHMLIDILTHDNQAYGCVFLNSKTNEISIYLSSYIILATGGAGQLYLHTTNPLIATGDGIVSAFRAGARIMDLEFFQFHPTVLKIDAPQRFLISEAVRGEGGRLINSYGERFMFNYHPLGELAPRDIVTRAIYFEILETQKDVYLDLRPIGENRIKRRFPNIYKKCLEYGIDITKDLVPISPAAHYFMGGIETDEYGRTSIRNLYACGEVACTGLHGANRLASNSLLEGLVFGKRCVDAILNDNPSLILEHEENINFKEVENDELLKEKIQKLKTLMWDKVGIIREESKLKEGEKEIIDLMEEIKGIYMKNRSFFEYKNMLTLSLLMIKSVILRKESRGAHFRIDYPTSKQEWKKHIIWEKGKEVIYREINSPPSFKKDH
jgi:L-aspartate oxidase